MSDDPRIVVDENVDWPVAYRAKLDGFTAEIVQDQSGDTCGDPRDADNLGKIVHWHQRYTIASDAERVDDDRFRSITHIERFLGIVEQAVCIVPLGMVDHSGVTFYAGSGSHACDAGGWDSGQVGFVYTTAERVRELCGEYPYKPRDFDGTADEWLRKQLVSEIRALAAYAEGNVFFHRITNPEGEEVDSCYGYLAVSGDGDDGLDDLRSEVRSLLDCHATERREQDETERIERERCARLDIATAAA